MEYLLLDENLEVVKTISGKELEKKLNGRSLTAYLMFKGSIDGYQIVENSLEFDADKYKYILSSSSKEYYASINGDFFAVSKKNSRNKKKLKLRKHKRSILVTLDGKEYNAARLIAKLFIKEYSEDKLVILKNIDKLDVSIKNLRIAEKKDIYSKAGKKGTVPIFAYENGVCVREYPSLKVASEELYFSIGKLRKILENNNKLDLGRL